MNTKLYKNTRQRKLVLSILKNTRSHPTADLIYDEAKKTIPHISKGTVYRNLAILQERGEVTELKIDGTIARYEVKQNPHYHFRCEQCDNVIDLNMPVEETLNHKAGSETGFQINSHLLEFHGLCNKCLQSSEKC